MRREQEIGRRAQRRIGGERLGDKDVEHGAAKLIGFERGQQRGFVDDTAARHVDHDRSGGQAAEFPLADHATRFVVERHVHRQDVALPDQRVECCRATHAQGGEPFIGDVGIEGHHGHAERVRAHGDFAADPTEANNAERLSLEFASHELGAIPHPVLHGQRGGRQLSQKADHGAEEQLGHGHRIAGGGVDDRHAEFGGDIERDVVDADTGTADDPQFRRGAQQLGGDSRRAAADDGVVLADAPQQFILWQRGDFINEQLGLGREQGESFRIDIVGDKNAKCHESTRKETPREAMPGAGTTRRREEATKDWLQRGGGEQRRADWPKPTWINTLRCGSGPEVVPAQRVAQHIAQGDEQVVARGRGVVAYMQLHAVGDRHVSPRGHDILLRRAGIHLQRQRGRERRGDAPFQRIAGDFPHLLLDRVERLPFTLADLDGEQLQQMAIAVGGGRSGALRSIEQTTRDIEANGPRAGHGPR